MPHELPLRRLAGSLAALAICLAVVLPSMAVTLDPEAEGGPHLVVSEVLTGGASASDEFIELYNPAPMPLPLEGLELIYVTASGATTAVRAEWPAGAPSVDPGSHVLIANASGIFAPIADALYASGIAGTGGSVALRIQGASTAIDAVGWGTAASTWLEGTAAPAPAAGSSLERLPGGALGSTQDTDDNAADFAAVPTPDPQNSTSPPVQDPGPDPDPTPIPAPAATPIPTPSGVMPIGAVRALPDGSRATIGGVALTASAFTDGGGYVADESGGLAVLVTGASFERGDLLVASGDVDDRYHQRTLRVDAADLEVLGLGSHLEPMPIATGNIHEAVEAELVAIHATIQGPSTALSGAIAFDVDDGSGVARVVVHDATGIGTSAWRPGATIELVGVVGQRDSTGGGSAGYRVQPRSPDDIGDVVLPSAEPSPSASPGSSGAPGPTASAGILSTIAQARSAADGTRMRVRGVVTLATGTIEDGSAVVQDASGAIVLRMSDGAGRVSRGHLVEATGTRSTKGGMATLRVSEAPRRVGQASEPQSVRRTTGAAGERDEARLLTVRGALAANARRASSGSVSFEIDDGSGPLRIFVAADSGIAAADLDAGAWVEVRGVLGQQTSGSQPLAGYRVWPRDAADLRLLAGAIDNPSRVGDGADGAAPGGGTEGRGEGSLATLLAGGSSPRRATVTLVTGHWEQLGLAGVVWDGSLAVGVADAPAARDAIEAVLADGAPVAVRISGSSPGMQRALGLPLVRIAAEDGLSPAATRVSPPATAIPPTGGPVWARLTGFLRISTGGPHIETASARVPLDVRCTASPLRQEAGSLIQVEGLAIAGSPGRLVLACDDVAQAPTVAPGAAPTADTTPARAVDARLRDVAASSDGPMLGALVLVGAAALLAAVCGWRAWERIAGGGDEAGRAPNADDVAEDGDAEADLDEPATPLTLVSLPRERGSP